MDSDFLTIGPGLVKRDPENEGLSEYAPGRLGTAAIELIGRTHQSFLQALQSPLEELVPEQMAWKAEPCLQQSTGEFLAGCTPGDVTIALAMAPFPCQALLRFPASLLFGVLDILLAAPAGSTSGFRTFVTEIELQILREFFDAFICALNSAWAPVCPVIFSEVAPGAVRTDGSQPDEAVAVVRSQLGPSDAGIYVDLALPAFFVRLADLKARESHASDSSGAPAGEDLLAAIGKANAMVDVVLQGSAIRLCDLLTIRKGQILSLGVSPDARFNCLVNENTLFTGEMVAVGISQGFEIASLVGARDHQPDVLVVLKSD
jgi:flagellar motor switch protein FliM